MINVTKTTLPPISEYNRYLKKIWKTHWLTNDGELVKDLEKKLSKLLGVEDLVLVNSATSGLLISLKALEINGEVITTPFTFAATTNVILWEGLRPIFADIDPNTFNIDPNDIERKITKNTSAILAVHVYGNPCDVENLTRIAKKHNLKLIFDAAHAFGVEYDKRTIIAAGDISILSFHATKTFHTIEGGAIYTKDKKLMAKLRLFRNFGIKSEEEILLPGINAKMNEFQAAMGLASISYFENKVENRKKIYAYYKNKLKGVKFQTLVCSKYNYSYMPIVFESKAKREKAYNALLDNGIRARKYFYPLTSNFPYVKEKYGKVALPISKNISDGILCLPIYTGLKIKDVEKIIKIIQNNL